MISQTQICSIFFLIFLLVPLVVAYAESYDVYVTASFNSSGCQNTNTCWSDGTITISQHDSITWHNDADYIISVTSGNILDDSVGESFDSGIISSKKTYTHIFDDAGNFSYFSILQPWMTGSIIVEPSDPTSELNSEPTLELIPDSEYIPEPTAQTTMNPESTSKPEPTCGVGTMLVNGFCKVMPSPSGDSIICGSGTVLSNGKCVAESIINDDSNGGGCLIATATYGTELAPQVQLLREIRDNQLLNTESGSFFIELFNTVYYSFSPHIADTERVSPIFRETVKLFITPLVLSLNIMSLAEDESSVLLWGSFVILINGLMYVGVPVGIVVTTKQIFKKR